MAELRQLHPFCVCGGAPKYQCGRCKSKKYCSVDCQKRDWPLHRQQCTNEQLVSAVVDNRGTDLALLDDKRELMRQPNWQRWLEITYDTLWRRAHAEGPPAPSDYYAFWIQIVGGRDWSGEAKITADVAYVWMAQEPTRLYMYTVAPGPQPDEEARAPGKDLIDADCVVFDIDVRAGREARAPSSLVYPVRLRRPKETLLRVTWDLRS